MNIDNIVDKILKNRFIEDVYKVTRELGREIYLVGGAVRDLILGKEKIEDFDFVLLDDPFQIVNRLSKIWGKNYKSYPFNTYEFEFEDFEIDFAVARKENYLNPGDLPTIEKVNSIEEDLKRRDFTINSIALCLFPEIKLIDPFNGKDDIENKKIKVLKKESFREDPTRAIRAIKYMVKLNFNLEIENEEFEYAKRYIKNVSFPRIKKELREISKLKKRREIVKELLNFNLLNCYFGEYLENEGRIVKFLGNFEINMGEYTKSEWIFILSIIIRSDEYLGKIDKFLERWEKKAFLDCFKNQKKEIDFNMNKKSFFISLLKSDLPYHTIKNAVKNFMELKTFVDGNYLLKMGFEGKRIGQIIRDLKIKKIEGKIKDKFEEIKFVENYFIR